MPGLPLPLFHLFQAQMQIVPVATTAGGRAHEPVIFEADWALALQREARRAHDDEELLALV